MAAERILIISAHPDDMEIGMGGTVAKLVDQGITVISAILTDGRRSANPFGFLEEQLATIRQEEAKRAASVLGIQTILFGEFTDLKSLSNYEQARMWLDQTVESVKPAEIYTLHPKYDRHPTHQVAGNLAFEIGRVRKLSVWAYEVWGLFPEWDRSEDISNTIGKKLLAISEHKSQIATVPYVEGVAGLNRWRAVFRDPSQTEVRCAYMEVFSQLCS